MSAHDHPPQLVNHIVQSTLSSLDVLESLSILSPNDLALVRQKLQSSLQHPSGIQTYNQPGFNQIPPPMPPRKEPTEVLAKALWTYQGSAPDDLTFQKDDIIIVDEEGEFDSLSLWCFRHCPFLSQRADDRS